MSWQETPYTLLLVSVAATTAVSGLYVWWYLRVRGARMLALILLASAAWCLGYALELGSTTLSTKLLWVKLQYPGIITAHLALFVFTVQFSGRERWLTHRNLAMLGAVPVSSILMAFTNEYHGLFWTNVVAKEVGGFSVLVFERGLGFRVHTLYSYMLAFGVIALLVQMLLLSVHLYRWQASALLVLALVPWFGNLLYLSDFNPFPHFDVTPPALAVAGLVFSWSVSRLRMGDILRVSREAIIEGMGDAVIVLDAEDRVVALNPAAERVLSRPAGEVVGRPVQEIWPKRWEGQAGPVAASGAGSEIVLKGEDGSRIYDVRISPVVDWRGHPVSRVVVLRDVTELERAEEALRESEERYRVLVEAAGDAIYVKDLEGRYVMVNSEAVLRMGLPKEEILGRTPSDLFPPDVAQKVAEGDLRVLRTGIVADTEEHHPYRRRASIVHSRKAPLRTVDGRIVGLVVIDRDITDRKRLEEQLLRAQRMEAAGRIAGQVAHDFNNLLAPLMAYPELIKAQLPEDHPALAFCDSMLEAAERMAAINEDMMALGRRGHFDQQAVDLNQLVSDAVDQMVGVPETLRVRLKLAEDLLPVGGSPAQLLRVIVNLISNAREAMQDAGWLTVRTDNVYIDSPVGRYDRVDVGEYVRLEVCDTGCGIPPEIQDRIFDAFFTTKTRARRRGCGLGLSIVQAIVGDHKGRVELESEVGKGTVFTVYLPISRNIPKAKPKAELRGGTETVMVVDDDQLQREVVRQLLERLGYRVVEAASGEDAVAYLAEHPADLLVLDMIMPTGMDGAETYRRALQLRPDTPAVIVSGFAESDRVSEAQRLGAGAYVRKPVNLESLARAVREELDQKARRAEPRSCLPVQPLPIEPGFQESLRHLP